ncbi:hypothetical protein MGMO_147c00010 [Methyloglobulus morosus KoM1]|jgi:hypothetical protein|uniref:Uncharacterized protein n=1 Tax=Methyloglobulus morosus KoM1 TaxID=1116472 RepID=V5BQB6_9GAMM|nr:hypothetical protein [Methyloglobulus morosus]ESS68362.1 hypothetical protein MGMO_147c00010 [Methyloglobulus morosus KoM1]
MANETSKPAVKPEAQNTPEIENDADDIFEEGEFVPLTEETDKETIRRDARRKIEIYWEKKRLREQFEDFDDSEFGF